MIEYKYNKKANKFTENGHTMFEEDVLKRLKRLAYLEEQMKHGELHQPTVGSSISSKDLIQAFLDWLESDDCWVTDADGNKIEGAVIDGKDIHKYAEKYYL